MNVRKQTYVRKYLCQEKSPTIEASLTTREAADLVAGIRHLISGGDPSHNEATPVIEFLFEVIGALGERR